MAARVNLSSTISLAKENTMCTSRKTRLDDFALTPETWRQIKESALARARDERARALRAAVLGTPALLRAAAAGLRRMTASLGRRAGMTAQDRWNRYQAWRARRQAVRELSGLDDRSLKDMGLRRGCDAPGARAGGRAPAQALHTRGKEARSPAHQARGGGLSRTLAMAMPVIPAEGRRIHPAAPRAGIQYPPN
jgi:uncharacterized protein YjiS (DUF1127 family)